MHIQLGSLLVPFHAVIYIYYKNNTNDKELSAGVCSGDGCECSWPFCWLSHDKLTLFCLCKYSSGRNGQHFKSHSVYGKLFTYIYSHAQIYFLPSSWNEIVDSSDIQQGFQHGCMYSQNTSNISLPSNILHASRLKINKVM